MSDAAPITDLEGTSWPRGTYEAGYWGCHHGSLKLSETSTAEERDGWMARTDEGDNEHAG